MTAFSITQCQLSFLVVGLLLLRHTEVQATPLGERIPRSEGGKGKWERSDVLHLGLERRTSTVAVGRRDAEAGTGTRALGLGDSQDVTYNVLLEVGGTISPFVLDTGSADLWALSKKCSTCSSHPPVPLYDPVNFDSVAEVTLTYGDSRTGTHASGSSGSDTVGIAGVVLQDQFFAAVSDTDTDVLDSGAAGIFGLGFPMNSILWNQLYGMTLKDDDDSTARVWRRSSLPGPNQDLAMKAAMPDPELEASLGILSSFNVYGPLTTRLFLGGDHAPSFPSPQFTVTLQRTTPSLSGNVGTLTLGGLPPSVDDSALTWTDVRLYQPDQGGIVVPEAPDETYPYAWEVPLDNVYFDGIQLPASALGDVGLPGVGTSALIDTGNSLIRGPTDTVISILALLSNITSSPSPFVDEHSSPSADASAYSHDDYEDWIERFDAYSYAYPCGKEHRLTFEFAGKKFDVDPRDFGRPIGDADAMWCIPNIAPTDAPELGGYLYSWSLGEPFIRGTLTSFYYGNFTHPSSDPPRIGFLSTVHSDETLRLAADVRAAKSRGSYPETTISASTGTAVPYPVTTDPNGVVQASESPLPQDRATHPTMIPFGSNAGEERSSGGTQTNGARCLGLDGLDDAPLLLAALTAVFAGLMVL